MAWMPTSAQNFRVLKCRRKGGANRGPAGGDFYTRPPKGLPCGYSWAFRFCQNSPLSFLWKWGRRLRRVRRRGKRLVGGAVFCALINDGVIFVLDAQGSRIWQLLPAKYTSAMAVLIQMKILSAAVPLLYASAKHMEVRPFFDSAASAGLFTRRGWRRYTSSTSG